MLLFPLKALALPEQKRHDGPIVSAFYRVPHPGYLCSSKFRNYPEMGEAMVIFD
jgi:hypothetical protein